MIGWITTTPELKDTIKAVSVVLLLINSNITIESFLR